METLLHIVQTINFYLSDYILVVLLVGTGVFFSLRTRFVQVRCFGEGMRRVFGGFSMRGGRQKGGLSSFQALTTAIAAQVGTGNIIGSCSAILVGGARCHLLDVDHRFFRDVHHLRRGRSGPGDPGGPCGRHRLRRPCLLH